MKIKFNYKPWLTALCLAGAMSMTGQAFAANPFELDGNAVSSAADGDDWDVVNTTGGASKADTGLVEDKPEPLQAQFSGGGSKDEQDITAWKWRSGTPPAKDNLTHAYAAAYLEEDKDFILIFGMDRYDTSGDAQLGFWFLKDTVQPIGTGTSGTFSGEHQEGDVLVLVNFSNGGTVPTIGVYQWSGGAAQEIIAGEAVLCDGYIPTEQSLCGITNANSETAPWSYENKDVGFTDKFPPGAFFEGAINLTKLLPNDSPCFTNFLAESRSSTSITATLKDFATPKDGFNVCKIDVTKYCEKPRLNSTEDKIIYDIKGQVENSGFGTVYDVTLVDTPAADGDFAWVDCTTGVSLTQSPLGTLSTLAANGIACYTNTFTVPLDKNGADDTIKATAYTADAGAGTALTDSTTADCPNLQISPSLSISKTCTTAITLAGNNVAAEVQVSGTVCNTGDSRLDKVTVKDSEAGILLGPISLPKKDSTGDCVNYTGSYIPTQALDASGTATTKPTDVVFKDTVYANGTDIFLKAVKEQTANAQCPLCDCKAGGTC